jgi:hypothetical protein
MKKLVLASALAALVAAPAFATDNLLSNGSFEDGLTSWSFSDTISGSPQGHADPVVIEYGQAGNYPTGAYGESVPADNAAGNPGFDGVGTHGLYFSSDVGTQTISQSVSLVAGRSYTFGFDFYLPANGYANANGATFTASIVGMPFASFNAGSEDATTWTLASGSHTFVASQTGDFAFAFTANGYPAKDFVIDRVFLASTADVTGVPEAGTWAMMVVGFGAIGAASRRRRTSLTFA